MKRLGVCILGLACALPLCGCNSSNIQFNNELPHEQIHVSIDYGGATTNKATLTYSQAIDLHNTPLYNQKSNQKMAKLVGGDLLNVYYTDENKTEIDHVLVDPVESLPTLQVTNAIIPGEVEKRMDIVSADANIFIDHSAIEYVINEDGSFVALDTLPMWENLYGTYQAEQKVLISTTSAGKEVYRYQLVALYSYLPR